MLALLLLFWWWWVVVAHILQVFTAIEGKYCGWEAFGKQHC
jgi:hypothetical protein